MPLSSTNQQMDWKWITNGLNNQVTHWLLFHKFAVENKKQLANGWYIGKNVYLYNRDATMHLT